MANLGCITLGQSVVVLSPEHADIVAAEGATRDDVARYLFDHATRDLDALKRVGKYSEREEEYRRRKMVDAGDAMHRGLTADDILICVAGGDAGGHSAFIPSWSRTRASIMQHKPIGVCIDCD